ncbi:iron reductase domain protein [Amniculicola lignicola CBS 123094]|uniref:Iron reductase domain protein n=1 Tax=Amniculicola lignicola CBS 123094 TaxID=1392246 RepID=A0A6A5WZN0_9PLEO|nr:iron reductase domain protein [Amniculicola lignicola CBS 123094]
MRWTLAATWAASMMGLGLSAPAPVPVPAAAAELAPYFDSETGFQFHQYSAPHTLTSNIVYRIAVPSDAVLGTPYDIVIQVVCPNIVGWAALAWGGVMPRNPLTVYWGNSGKGLVSSRWATGHSTPQPYTGATYKLFTTGQKSNGTHWQFTAKCTGCSQWQGTSSMQYLNPKGTGRVAYASSTMKPSNPSVNTSPINQHEVQNYWSADLRQGQNADFAALVAKNGGA